mgnify:CR=1 FL=1
MILRGSRHVRATFHWLRASEFFSCSIANRPADFFLSQLICYSLIFLAIYSHPLSGMTLRQGEVLVRSACVLVFAGVNHASGIFAVIGHSGARTRTCSSYPSAYFKRMPRCPWKRTWGVNRPACCLDWMRLCGIVGSLYFPYTYRKQRDTSKRLWVCSRLRLTWSP